ncbi:AP-4 complex accessory subunit Tepsin-like isoform X2 [Ischnura elegans]|uniref:AP-4 complex accessory subunit Tepsin-like isoform X2 n=1 Tax=Ischnura elegans TaxID=197161 RepID=UPI001ED872CD|nr:AP-4 complex accessory subunit Tepsin-like isoform X2 [Ischnura elegans]
MDIADKVAFSHYLPLMTRATADDGDPTPGYMLEEIEKITFLADPHCTRLVGYLLQRLGRQSNNVKLKVLKIMHHLVLKGHISFRTLLRKNDGHIKMSTVNRSTSYFGSSRTADAVVRAAQNLLQVLFDPNLLRKDEEGVQEAPRSKVQLGALGSQGISQGKYHGFGNSAAEKDTIKGKVMDYFEKLLSPTDDFNEDIKYCLYGPAGNYEPPVIELKEENLEASSEVVPSPVEEVKTHIPGKAGGGWETDEDDAPKLSKFDGFGQRQKSSAVMSSSESIEKLDMISAKESAVEKKFIENFCSTKDLPLTPSELDKTMTQCSKMDGIILLQSLFQYLIANGQSIPEESAKHASEGAASFTEKSSAKCLMVALLFLEWFLQVGKVAPEICSAIMMPALETLEKNTLSIANVNAKSRKLKFILSNRNVTR